MGGAAAVGPRTRVLLTGDGSGRRPPKFKGSPQSAELTVAAATMSEDEVEQRTGGQIVPYY